MIGAWKLGPALVAGNSVVLKPAEDASLVCLRIVELALEAGMPEGVLQVVTGDQRPALRSPRITISTASPSPARARSAARP
jgi:gamma-glutamyl-gamma-aminobutyraldehyde dehydrogenase